MVRLVADSPRAPRRTHWHAALTAALLDLESRAGRAASTILDWPAAAFIVLATLALVPSSRRSGLAPVRISSPGRSGRANRGDEYYRRLRRKNERFPQIERSLQSPRAAIRLCGRPAPRTPRRTFGLSTTPCCWLGRRMNRRVRCCRRSLRATRPFCTESGTELCSVPTYRTQRLSASPLGPLVTESPHSASSSRRCQWDSGGGASNAASLFPRCDCDRRGQILQQKLDERTARSRQVAVRIDQPYSALAGSRVW